MLILGLMPGAGGKGGGGGGGGGGGASSNFMFHQALFYRCLTHPFFRKTSYKPASERILKRSRKTF